MTTRRNTTGMVIFTPSARHAGPHDSHAALVAQAREYITLRRGWCLKVLGGLGQRSGIADILCCFPPMGRLVAVECKSGKAQLRKDQRLERDAMIQGGALFVEMRSIEDLERALVGAGIVDRPALVPDGPVYGPAPDRDVADEGGNW